MKRQSRERSMHGERQRNRATGGGCCWWRGGDRLRRSRSLTASIHLPAAHDYTTLGISWVTVGS